MSKTVLADVDGFTPTFQIGSLELLASVLELKDVPAPLMVELTRLANNCDLDGLQQLGVTFTVTATGDVPSSPVSPRYKKAPIPNSLRKKVFERDGYRCVLCADWHDLAADHIIPESKGGPTTLDNLQTLCRTCNLRKGSR